MAGGGGSDPSTNTRSLEYTPTWAVAAVCFMFVIVSLIGERSLHHLGIWLSRTKRKPLRTALEKMKEELMLLGFISLIITVTASYISKICIRSSFYDKQRMPCKLPHKGDATYDRMMGTSLLEIPRRELASTAHSCPKEHEPFVSFLGLEQLHRFIFVMAVTHVIYSCLTMLLAIMKVYSWRPWEQEAFAHADNQENLAALTRNLTLKRQSTFVACQTSTPGASNRLLLYFICFFRQFGLSVTKPDYLALRMGFLTKHNLGPKYDFHLYMIRSMEDEFKDIIGISPLLWIFVVLFMLFNVEGTNLYFWISFLPIVMVLVVGTKLQHIIATLALDNSGLSGPLNGFNLRPRDELFWFKRPRLLLRVIHFILFQVGFELATFFWIWWQFGWHSCYMSRRTFVYVRVFSGLLVQILCSYSTLPLYAIVTQMGSNNKKLAALKSFGNSLYVGKGQDNNEIGFVPEKQAPYSYELGPLHKPRTASDAASYFSSESTYHSKHNSVELDTSGIEEWYLSKLGGYGRDSRHLSSRGSEITGPHSKHNSFVAESFSVKHSKHNSMEIQTSTGGFSQPGIVDSNFSFKVTTDVVIPTDDTAGLLSEHSASDEAERAVSRPPPIHSKHGSYSSGGVDNDSSARHSKHRSVS
ncbi:MLO-like protein 14 [Selaginella moellendorffii]|uniref:MLO-like protein 14 n=1 Tax=Selaginella moellendorffii TaxID=88036 RepID=UPI000D1C9C0C|nr:MLO-like protein 14 [Selaginella moellendorffii]|eukprot:XP_024525902.1 MLO-like protein 14 [Selaginella moellendorffii]